MEEARSVSISELLRIGRPLTGASSIARHGHDQPSSVSCISCSSLDLAPHAFRALNFPVVLVGNLDLSEGNGSSRICSSGNSCFSFSDGTARVCCAVLEIDMAVIGRKICVLAWNFVPVSPDRGILEIIKWRVPGPAVESGDFASSSSPVHFPRKEHLPRARSRAWGALIAVSPVFSVPLSSQQSRSNQGIEDAYSDGFLTQLNACSCRYCEKSNSAKDPRHIPIDQRLHSFDKPVFIYFHGSCASWRPILSMLPGNAVAISGLKKKYISTGESESLIFVTTEGTTIHEYGKLADKKIPRTRSLSGKENHVGSYCGIVSGVFMNGTVVELDRRNVWLLLAAPQLDLPHSLRVGALIVVRNALFIDPKFPWIKMLLLGSFIKTSIEIKSFSVVDSGCHFTRRSRRLLWDFTSSLPFYARFWALLLTSSFQKKFAGVLSDKEILGTRKKEGFVENYCKLHLSLSTVELQRQRGAFLDFCDPCRASFNDRSNGASLMMAVPLSNFIAKCTKNWMSTLTKTRREFHCLEKFHERMSKMIISSEELGLNLVGFLKASPCSGRLQLVDSTGCVDVMMPALPRHLDEHVLYEVKEYKMVIYGFPWQLDHVLLLESDPLSCRSIFQQFQAMKKFDDITIYAHFAARNLRSLNTCAHHEDDVVDHAKSGIFDLLLVTHRFPHFPNFPDHSMILNRKNAFAEAVILPYTLNIKQIWHQDIHHADDSAGDGIRCLITFGSDATREAYIMPKKEKISASDDAHDLRRIVLEFEQQSINLHQRLCIGKHYILKCPGEQIPPIDSAQFLINSKSTMWSVDFPGGTILQNKGLESGRLFHHCPDTINEHLDARLHLPEQGYTEILKNCFMKAHNMLGYIFNVSSLIEGRFPESGNLISLRGDVQDVHISQLRENPNGRDRNLCVHVCDGSLTVKVRGTFGKNVHPFGLEPGANATFHRVLVLSNSNELAMIPVSCVVINYVQKLNFPPLSDLPAQNDFPQIRSSVLISELTRHGNKSVVDLRCRVAGTFLLILEDSVSESAVRIPLAGFLLDDGSSLCCCWADSDRARTMLQLEESSRESFFRDKVNAGFLLKKMVQKHRRIIVRNFAARVHYDSSLANATFLVGSGGDLSKFDLEVLKSVILRSLNGPNLDVAGHVVNLEELTCLDEGISRIDALARDSMRHIWATNVDYCHPLTEARNLINELM